MGSVLFYFALEGDPAGTIFFVAELGGGCRRSANDGSYSITAREQLIPLAGMKKPISESGGVQRRPEAIAGSRKVQPRGSGVESGIDPAEQNLQVRRNQVRNDSTVGLSKVFRGGSLKL